MSDPRLQEVLSSYGIPDYVEQAGQATLARKITGEGLPVADQANPERLPRLGFVYESQGLAAYQRAVARREGSDAEDARQHFAKAYTCWQALVSLPDPLVAERSIISPLGLELVRRELGDEVLPAQLMLGFRLAVAGLLGNRPSETRLDLRPFDLLDRNVRDQIWRDAVIRRVFGAFCLLVRKDGGWTDIQAALDGVAELRQLQDEHEDSYLSARGDELDQTDAAVELVGHYHLAQLVTVTGQFLRDGDVAPAQAYQRLDRHRERASDAFQSVKLSVSAHLADLLWAGCRALVQNSLWTHVGGLGEQLRQFARLLTDRGRPNPVIELWPSQQSALQRSLLDPYPRAILVEMPTSAGKTLLAKFSIVQSNALNPNGMTAYIVPTRALVNQMTMDLRSDFQGLGLRVEQAVPAFELDPTEERLLLAAPHVLVTTPEKLDLLVRRDHPSTRNIALVIADEAHNIHEDDRGPRLELLLGTLKRDRPGARFLLLSPFLPNADELVSWLGDDRSLPPIGLEWKPSRKVVGAVRASGRGRSRTLALETLPAVDNTDLPAGVQIALAQGGNDHDDTVPGVTRATVQAVISRGAVLVLCYGQVPAMERAKQIAEDLPPRPDSPMREAVIRYIETEVGRDSNLISCLRHGVAFHHAGLSHDVRWLIEGLIRSRDVDVVCGTTTLAQGVNFPISTAIIESLRKGRDGRLSYQDFWNIAGRAGRALIDTVGLVALPSPDPSQRERFIDFLEGEAEEISSKLATIINRIDEIANRFDMETVRRIPELSTLMQFLSHALRVSRSGDVAEEIDDLLRASLVYHQTQKESQAAAARLAQLCRSYINQIRDRRDIIALADQTGFATPSVLALLAEKSRHREFARPVDWTPDHLFGDDVGPLRDRVQAIAALPEMQLGVGSGAPFNAGRIAEILRGWVTGEPLGQLAEQYPVSNDTDPDRRLGEFSRYLFSRLLGRAAWGLGALEGVCLAGQDEPTELDDAAFVPSMIFFGVRRKESVWLRMAGVPRVVADGLGEIWRQRGSGEPGSYDDLRSWVTDLDDATWTRAIPAGSPLTPGDMRLLWQKFAG